MSARAQQQTVSLSTNSLLGTTSVVACWKLAAWIVLIGSAFLFVASGDLPSISPTTALELNSPTTQKPGKRLGTTGKSAKTPTIPTVGNSLANFWTENDDVLDQLCPAHAFVFVQPVPQEEAKRHGIAGGGS